MALTVALPAVVLGLANDAWSRGNAVVRPNGPVAIVRSFQSRLHQITQCRRPAWSPEAEAAQFQLASLVDQTLSIPDLGRNALGVHWAEVTDQQRQLFLKLFHDLIVMRLARGLPLPEGSGTQITVIPRRDGVAEVDVAVDGDTARPASLDYRLRWLEGRWQLVDLVLDGQSVADQYRKQFDRIITRDSFDGLIDRMRRKLG